MDIITKMKRKMEYVRHENNIPFKKHKLLDLRTMERFAKFDMFKCIYKVAPTVHQHITTHSTSTEKEEKKAEGVLVDCLLDGLADLHDRGIPPYAIIHMYVKCDGLETDFMFTGTGPARLTLKQLREGEVRQIVSQFASIIQSGKEVSIDDKTLFTFYAFIPPVEYR